MLNNRLEKIASLVDKDIVLVDIGCDHGYLCIDLVKNNKIKYAYASDVALGPLNNVKSNVANALLSNKINCLLSNGLEAFKEIYFDNIVIAGMGGSLIVDILSKDIVLLKNKTLILQPNINSYKVRKFLLENHFKITNEAVVLENNIYYEVIKATYGINESYTELELNFGKLNLVACNDIIYKMEERIIKNNKLLQQIPSDLDKYQEIKKENKLIEDYLNEIK